MDTGQRWPRGRGGVLGLGDTGSAGMVSTTLKSLSGGCRFRRRRWRARGWRMSDAVVVSEVDGIPVTRLENDDAMRAHVSRDLDLAIAGMGATMSYSRRGWAAFAAEFDERHQLAALTVRRQWKEDHRRLLPGSRGRSRQATTTRAARTAASPATLVRTVQRCDHSPDTGQRSEARNQDSASPHGQARRRWRDRHALRPGNLEIKADARHR